MYGKRMLHPASTGRFEEGISAIKEHDVNVWFYTRNGHTIAIDAGHLDFKEARSEMAKIDIVPENIRHVLLTHSDVDHCGGVDRTAEDYLFPNAQVYIGAGEEAYFDGNVCRMIKIGIPLMNPVRLREGYKKVRGGDVFYVDDIKVEVIDVPGHTIGHVSYIIDDKILFSGDCLAINEAGGYSLFDFFTQNPTLNKKSLHHLKDVVSGRDIKYVCTGHSGVVPMSEKVFAHIDESAKSTFRHPFDPSAPKSITAP